jgi:mRNA interferase YafQ
MLKPFYTSPFNKDAKKIAKQHKDIDQLKEIVKKLIMQETLDANYKDHKLKGQYEDHRECHLQPDWLLIYLIKDDSITFVRTGSHSELFKK